MLYCAIKSLLFKLDAETSHYLALKSLQVSQFAWQILLKKHANPIKVMGIHFPNKLGLAAGLDKNGDYIDALASQGFGFIEIGTLTPVAQEGNAKPRLFRLEQHSAIINRMGFNNKGIDHGISQVKKKNSHVVIGINIGKNKNTPNEKAVDDYIICFQKAYCYADYITVNISSPNTPGLRDLQHGDELNTLLASLKKEQSVLHKKHGKYTPIAVKIAPDLSDTELQSTVSIILKNNLDGIIATNTTLNKKAVQHHIYGAEQGGLSGAPLTNMSNELLIKLKNIVGDKLPIIAVGGIMSAKDAKQKFENGADLIQLYTGYIYHGPQLIQDILKATK